MIKNKNVLSIPALQLAVLKSIYELQKMSFTEEATMQHSIVEWNKCLKLKKDYGTMNAVDEENQIALEEMAWLINKNEEGRLDKRKALFKDREVDYKKFHKIPGLVTNKDKLRAQSDFEKLMAKNPDDYK